AHFDTVRCRRGRCGRSRAHVCVNPTHVQVALLRRDIRAVVTGPDSADEAVRKTVEGYILGCLAAALATAGASTPFAAATFFGAFKTCILAITAEGAVGAVLKQLDLKVDTSQTHWAPV